uniref:Uncharacterized protein n=1 Tax=Setaria digitata TaxID=48799 RepID=A0A915Q3C8_9BILA
MYSKNENFIGTNKETTETGATENHRMLPYKAAILGVCQLQLKICSKLIELASPSCPTLFGLTTFKPSTLKRIAGRSILLHPCHSPCDFVGIFCHKSQTNGDIDIDRSDNSGSCYHRLLPNELIKFLQNGAVDYD